MAKKSANRSPVKEKESPLVASLASYSPDNLRKSVSNYVMLNNYAQEGLSYKNKAEYINDVKHINGLYDPEVSNDENTHYLKHTTEDYNKGLVSYLSQNFKPALNEIDDDSLYQIGLNYLPDFETGNKEFEGLRKIVNGCHSKLEEISKNPQDYLMSAVKGKDPFVKNAILSRPEWYLKAHNERFNEIMSNKVRNYGFQNFVSDVRDSYKVDSSTLEAANAAKERIFKDTLEKYNLKVKEGEGYWNAKVEDDFQKELSENESFIAANQTLENYKLYSLNIPSELIIPIAKRINGEKEAHLNMTLFDERMAA